MCEHSSGYEKAKRYYKDGLWTKAMLKMLVARDLLTAQEYEEITGTDDGGQT